MKRSLRNSFIFRALLVALLAVLAIVPVTAAQQSQSGEMTPVELVEKVSPAVVTVINEQQVSDMLGNQQTVQAGAGTGFIIDNEGHIVTNWHVVTQGTSFSVIMADGTQVPAKLIGQDPRDDLAVVQIDASKVTTTVPLGDSSALKQGQTVLAIGSPLGDFGNTVTSGIISALNRNQLENPNSNYCQNYTNLIQHDAPINPGNSGGPLFNLKGEVIGVNTLGIPTTPDGTPVQGIFFAVPSNTVKAVVDELINTGHISLPYIGISLVELNPQIASINKLPVNQGIYVDSVEPGSPAEAAGLQQGDIITKVDGKEITIQNSLSDMLINYQPGQTVELTVLRSGQPGTVNLTFGEVDPSVFEQCTLQGG
jgi:S1-C subfamily serine protease